MNEELIDIITEENIEIEPAEIIETDVAIDDVVYDVTAEETVATIEIEPAEEIEIEIEESIGWVGGDSERHYSLLGRDERDQHPITAITGLREELDDIEKLKTVFSNKYNHADYYLWEEKNGIPQDASGLFVSFHPSTNKIKVCTYEDDIFGVTVTEAAFVGGQDEVARNHRYGLVVCSGVVAVRCESNVAAGDSVVSNSYGYAQKAYSGYGYKVIGIQNINGAPYAIIPLGISVNQINEMMIEFDEFGDRMTKAETNIISAINVAQEAYNKASESYNMSDEALKNAIDAIGQSSGAMNEVDKLGDVVSSVNQTATQAKAIAETAVTSAEGMRNEAIKKANDALDANSELRKEFEAKSVEIDAELGNIALGLLETKENIDEARNGLQTNIDNMSAELNSAKADLNKNLDELSSEIEGVIDSLGTTDNVITEITKRVDNNEASIGGLTAWKDETSTSITNIEQKTKDNSAEILALTAWKSDVNDDVASIASIKTQSDQNKSSIESITSWQGTTEESIAQVKQQSAANGASIKSLTEWKGEADKTIASIEQNVSDAESNIEAITSWQGDATTSIANIQQKTTENESNITALTSWQNDAKASIATIEQKSSDNAASINSITTWKNDLTIGGRNLLPSTDFGGESKRYEILEGDVSEGGFRFTPIVPIESGVDYVLSAKIRGSSDVVFYEINDGGNVSHFWIIKDELSDTEYKPFSIRFKVDVNKTLKQVYICTKWGQSVAGDWFEIAPNSLQLERGTIATDWTPAIEDVAESIAAIKQKADANESNIKAITIWKDAASESITSIEEKSNKHEASITALTEWKDGANRSISSIEQTTTQHESSISALTSWQNEAKESIAKVEQKAGNNESKIATMTTWQNETDIAMATIKQKADANGASINSIVSNVDKYSVGEYSQSYGLSREQASSILSVGMIYIPTKHSEAKSHSECFVGEDELNEFTPGYYYTWDGNDWLESSSPLVAFFSEELAPSGALKYWYVDSNEAPDGYEANALYVNIDGVWQKVNILAGNANNRIVSNIKQTANEIALEISNARGSNASLSERIDETEATVQTTASWVKGVGEDGDKLYNLATIQQTASEDGASLSLVVADVDGNKVLNGASIVLGQNNKDSYINIDADCVNFDVEDFKIDASHIINLESAEINLTGYVKLTDLSDENPTTTIINGANITTGVIKSANYASSDGQCTDGTSFDLNTGEIVSKNFKIGSDGTLDIKNYATQAELSLKVGYDENNQIISMINEAADVIQLKSNRLVIDSDYFSLSKEGVVSVGFEDGKGFINTDDYYLFFPDFIVSKTPYAAHHDSKVLIGRAQIGATTFYGYPDLNHEYNKHGVYFGYDGITLKANSQSCLISWEEYDTQTSIFKVYGATDGLHIRCGDYDEDNLDLFVFGQSFKDLISRIDELEARVEALENGGIYVPPEPEPDPDPEPEPDPDPEPDPEPDPPSENLCPACGIGEMGDLIWSEPATCISQGCNTYSCSYCDGSDHMIDIDPDAHVPGTLLEVYPHNSKPNVNVYVYECELCGKAFEVES